MDTEVHPELINARVAYVSVSRASHEAQISIHDAFAFVLAETHPGCILLTGDSALRTLAERSRIEVHGILWVCDQFFEGRLSTAKQLHTALSKLATDSSVRLPKRELAAYLRRFQA